MNDERNFSDERLNAFIDNQLGTQECDDILAAIALDVDLGQRLCALRTAKEMVRHAYGHVPQTRRKPNLHLPIWGGSLAASLALAVGLLLGWQGHHVVTTLEAPTPIASWADSLFANERTRVLIHLDNSRTEEMVAALDLAEAYLAKVGSAHIEIIANNTGLDLLRVRTTPYAARIHELKLRHQQVAFIACGQTIARLRGVGQDVLLLPEAAVTRTAIEHVAERVQQGWTYLKI